MLNQRLCSVPKRMEMPDGRSHEQTDHGLVVISGLIKFDCTVISSLATQLHPSCLVRNLCRLIYRHLFTV